MEVRRRQSLERLKQRLSELPTLPAVLVDLLHLRPTMDDYFERVVELVGSDPAFAARTLAQANSVLSAPSTPIKRLQDAITRIGPRETVHVILAASAARVFVPQCDWERGLWHHALQTAELAKRTGAFTVAAHTEPDELYLAGLLHDIGRFVLYLEAPEELRLVDETAWTTPQALIEAEEHLCGFTHAELGYQAAAKWSLPAKLALVIRHHHGARVQVDGDLEAVVAAVRVADWISVVLGRDRAWEKLDDAGMRAALARLPGRPPGLWTDRVLFEVRTALDQAKTRGEALGL
jgi:putative nucleotidyltransferase with HDIG domain